MSDVEKIFIYRLVRAVLFDLFCVPVYLGKIKVSKKPSMARSRNFR